MSIILASGSASRRAILEGAGIPFEVRRPAVDEDALKKEMPGLTPAELALALAEAKAKSLDAPGALVIGADQVMEFDGQAYDKPKSREELRQRLAEMSGKPHHLRGGVALVRDGETIATVTDTSTLTMRALSAEEIDLYIETIPEEIALGTVGGYALEGEGVRLFESVEGDFFSILGLPFLPVLKVLREQGMIPW